ncbi:hypothetical protein [Streptomyces olivochromogenes]|uniref:hypothetical protein n=1 Tax=Streptomyces olivochromogenes TaxID=1963 RepID=UPI0036B171DE
MSEPFALNEPLSVGEVVRRKTVEVADLREFPAGSPAVLEEAQRLANEQTQGEPDGVFAGVLAKLPQPLDGETARAYGSRLLVGVKR